MEKAKRGNFYPKRGIWLEQYCQSREGLEFFNWLLKNSNFTTLWIKQILEILCFLNQHLNLLVQFSNKLESFCNYRQCENYEYLNDKSSKKLWFICLIICLCRVVHVPPTIDIHAIVSRGDKHNFYDWMVTFFHTFFSIPLLHLDPILHDLLYWECWTLI